MPVLRCTETNQQKSIDTSSSVNGFSIARCGDADFFLGDPLCDDTCHCKIRSQNQHLVLVPNAKTAVNGNVTTTTKRIRVGDRIGIGSSLLVVEGDKPVEEPTRMGVVDNAQTYANQIDLPRSMSVVLGREKSPNVYRLDHPLVSRRHVELTHDRTHVSIRDLGSANGTFIDGKRLVGRQTLKPEQKIGIGPFFFVFRNHKLIPVNRGSQPSGQTTAQSSSLRSDVSLRGLTRTLTCNGQDLLHDIDLDVPTGSFVAIIGPSGAGKSTLLKAIGRREIPQRTIQCNGEVLLGGMDVDANFEQIKSQIAYVPQHEILFDELTLEASLRYTAALRLPSDTTTNEVRDRIAEILQTVDLAESAQTRIRNLSGGQRKRAALANELLAQPSLLLLDEVTSGLDELTDAEMMQLFAKIAHEGKTVICVTHSLACVPTFCDQVVALTRYGRLGFFGSTEDAIDHFNVSQIGDLYEKLNVSTPSDADNVAADFQSTTTCRPTRSSNAVVTHPASTRWHAPIVDCISSATDLDLAFSWRQFGILVLRYAHRLSLDRMGIAMRLIQTATVTGLVAMVFGDVTADPVKQATAAFILTLSSFWIGCNNAAKEIVSQRRVFEQERNVVVESQSFAWSKFALLSLVASLQSITLILMTRYFCGLSGTVWAWSLLGFTIAMAGTALGLAISAISRNEQSAVAAVPIVMIPQLILAGAIVSLDGIALGVSRVSVTSYWAVQCTESVALPVSKWISSGFASGLAIIAVHVLAALYFTFHGLQTRHS